jgi:hypothetical protein
LVATITAAFAVVVGFSLLMERKAHGQPKAAERGYPYSVDNILVMRDISDH